MDQKLPKLCENMHLLRKLSQQKGLSSYKITYLNKKREKIIDRASFLVQMLIFLADTSTISDEIFLTNRVFQKHIFPIDGIIA